MQDSAFVAVLTSPDNRILQVDGPFETFEKARLYVEARQSHREDEPVWIVHPMKAPRSEPNRKAA